MNDMGNVRGAMPHDGPAEPEACLQRGRRPIVDPNSEITVFSQHPDWERKEKFQVSEHLPIDFSFKPEDKRLGFISDPHVYQQVTQNVLVPCVDTFLMRRLPDGQKEVFTIVREQWPLPDYRWTLGGRRINLGADHPLSASWNRFYDVLLMVYREAGIQPAQVNSIAPLIDSEMKFIRETAKPSSGREVRITPSFCNVAELVSGAQPQLHLTRGEAGSPMWIGEKHLEDTSFVAELSDFMRLSLSLIFKKEVSPISSELSRGTFLVMR